MSFRRTDNGHSALATTTFVELPPGKLSSEEFDGKRRAQACSEIREMFGEPPIGGQDGVCHYRSWWMNSSIGADTDVSAVPIG